MNSSPPDLARVLGPPPSDESQGTVIDVPPTDSGGGGDLSLAQASRLSGIPETTLRRRIDEGELPATKDGRSWKLSKTVVLQVGPLKKRETKADRARDVGRLAASAFPLFAAGTPLDDVVVRLEADPAAVRALFGEWMQCRALTASYLATPAAPSGPTFDHPPSAAWDCCAGHKAMHATEKR
jgi:excisionase family DNA binding protein